MESSKTEEPTFESDEAIAKIFRKIDMVKHFIDKKFLFE